MDYVTVVIPSYNRKTVLDEVLDSYYIQDRVGEVIIIDDCSQEDYSSVIYRYTNKYKNIKTIYHRNDTNKGAGASRNIGLELATGKWILWGEDDAFLKEDYVSELLSVVKKDHSTVAFGSIYYGITVNMNIKDREAIIRQQQNEGKKLFDPKTFVTYYRIKCEKTEVPCGHALILLERKAYEGVRYYEGYKVNGLREETDAQIQLLKKGYSIIYDSDTCCYHYPTVMNGGQHTSNRIKSDIWKIINNNIFWDRHYNFLKEKYNLRKSKLWYKNHLINEIIIGYARYLKRLYVVKAGRSWR